MSRRFFISHAGPDKPLALAIKDALGGDAWVDVHEIGLGDVLAEEISAGISGASDYVLLWSEHSAKSAWVKHEMHMAFIRYLEDRATSFRIVALDDTELPLYLRPMLQDRTAKKATEIAAHLLALNLPAVVRRSFINRRIELGQIEDCIDDRGSACLWIHGFPGVGKRSLVKEALNHLLVDPSSSISIPIDSSTLDAELNLKIAGALHRHPAPPGMPVSDIVKSTCEMLADFVGKGGVATFTEADSWLEEDGRPGRIAKYLASSMAQEPQNKGLLIFTSRRRPKLDGPAVAQKTLKIDGLSERHAVALLHSLGVTDLSEETLLEAARGFGGHPLALEMVAKRLPLDEMQMQENRRGIATDLIDPDIISPDTWNLMEIISMVDGPLSETSLAGAAGLDSERFRVAVNQATELSLVELNDIGFLSIHRLVSDYFLRSARKRSDYGVVMANLSCVLEEELKLIPEDSEKRAPLLISTVRAMALSNRFNEAKALWEGLTGAIFSSAEQLFHEKRYRESLEQLEACLSGDTQVDLKVECLRMKALANVDRFREAREIGDRLERENPNNARVLRDRGRVEYAARNWDEAIRFYERAIPNRGDNSQLYVDIAQVRARLEDWAGVVAYAKTAVDLRGGTPYALSLYAQGLEETGNYPEAEKMMRAAIAKEPSNGGYRHRLGRVLLRNGRKEEAISCFRKSIELDGTLSEPRLSLAGVLIDQGDIDSAQRVLEDIPSQEKGTRAVSLNLQGRAALSTGDLAAAMAYVDEALNARRDAQNVYLAIRVRLAQGLAGDIPAGQARAYIRVLCQELNSLGSLDLVGDLLSKNPDFFEEVE